MKRFTMLFATAVATLTLATSAHASSLRFDLLESRFYDPIGGNILKLDDTFTSSVSEVAWGATGSTPIIESSGYQYISRPVPFTEAPADVFALGSFTHINNPIPAGTSITGVSLGLRGLITLIADDLTETALGEKTFDFDITHNETTNVRPCDPDGAIPCPDVVTFNNAEATDSFDVDGVAYTLSILGFSTGVDDAENGIFTPSFISEEGFRNNRILAASFSEVAPIPLPASMLLLLGGVGVLGGMRKLNNRKAA